MSLISHYPLNGDAKDLLNRYNGSINGVTFTDGLLGGKAAEFNGINNTIGFGVGDSIFPLPEFSFSIWINSFGTTPSSGTSPALFGATYGVRLRLFSNRIEFGLDNGTAFIYTSSPSTYDIFNNDIWHHVAITATPTSMSLFIDGKLASTRATTWLGKTRWGTDSFVLGRDNNNSNYYFRGLAQDFKIYDHALSEKEIQELALGLSGSFKPNVEMQSFSDSTGITPSQNLGAGVSAIIDEGQPTFLFSGSGFIDTGNKYNFKKTDSFAAFFEINIKSHSSRPVAAAGIIGKGHYYSNTWGVHLRNNHQIAFEVSGNPTRNGSTSLLTPAISIDTWHKVLVSYKSGLMEIFLNGVLVGTSTYTGTGDLNNNNNLNIGARPGDSTRRLIGKMRNVKLFSTGLSQTSIDSLFQTGMSIDNHHNIHSKQLVESGIKNPNILDYTTWVIGSSGSQPGFSSNGPASENHIVSDVDPFGKTVPVWATIGSTDNDNDGGWNGNAHPADHTKMHRISVWMRRTVTGTGNTYIGTTGSTVYNRTNGSANGNPYFWSGGLSSGSGWVLFVGHVWPSGSGVGANHPDSGQYTVSGGKVNSNMNDFILGAGSVNLGQRAYLFYSTNTATIQQFVYPRIDVCDGNEPSVQALLGGFDSINQDRINELGSSSVPDKPSIKYDGLGVGELSEVGVTRGLVSWLPLIGDTKDRVTNEVATNNGAIAVGDGYEFDGSNTLSMATVIPTTGDQQWTVSAWVYLSDNTPSILNNFNSSNQLVFNITGGRSILYLNSGANDSYVYGTRLAINQWVHIAFIYNQIDLRAQIYLNGLLDATSNNIESGDQPSGIPSTTVFGTDLTGKLRNVKTHNVDLTSEEVAQEYSAGIKASLNKNTAFSKEFIEV